MVNQFIPQRQQVLPPITEPIPTPGVLENAEGDPGPAEDDNLAGQFVEEGTREVNGEDLSDLFDVSYEDVMGDTEEGMKDLTEVTEEDVLGGGGEAALDDVVSVSYKDVTGYDYVPTPIRKVPPRSVRARAVPPPTPTTIQRQRQ